MKSRHIGYAVWMGAAAGGMAAMLYWFAIRPWHQRWGATDGEVRSSLPGDDLIPAPKGETTRAVAIEAPPSEVWPWLIQIGQQRGGFYSYTWLENLIGCQIRNADCIVPEWQQVALGDLVYLHPQAPPLFVNQIEPQRALVLSSTGPCAETRGADRDFTWSWAFVLNEQEPRRTRLLVRVRADWSRGPGNWLWNRCGVEPIHFLMERKMLLGIKQRAERRLC